MLDYRLLVRVLPVLVVLGRLGDPLHSQNGADQLLVPVIWRVVIVAVCLRLVISGIVHVFQDNLNLNLLTLPQYITTHGV